MNTRSAREYYAPLAEKNMTLGDLYFDEACRTNSFQAYCFAAISFSEAIIQLISFSNIEQMTDDDYRHLISYNFKYLHSLLHLANNNAYFIQEAFRAMNHAIEAFNNIEQPTDLELALGDPTDNIAAFLTYVDAIAFKPGYIESAIHQQHNYLFKSHYLTWLLITPLTTDLEVNLSILNYPPLSPSTAAVGVFTRTARQRALTRAQQNLNSSSESGDSDEEYRFPSAQSHRGHL